LLPRIREAVFLDTHVARPEEIMHRYEVGGITYPVRLYIEGGRKEPFSGLREHAKWLLREDVLKILRQAGFTDIQEVALEEQRNGLRIRLFARR